MKHPPEVKELPPDPRLVNWPYVPDSHEGHYPQNYLRGWVPVGFNQWIKTAMPPAQ